MYHSTLYRVVHHKSMWNHNQPIEGEFPKEFVDKVLAPYVRTMHRALAATPSEKVRVSVWRCGHHVRLSMPPMQTLFLNNSGRAFSSGGLTVYYVKM